MSTVARPVSLRFVFRCHVDSCSPRLFARPAGGWASDSFSDMLNVFHIAQIRSWVFSFMPKMCQCLQFWTWLCGVGNARFPKILHHVIPWLSGFFIKFSMDGIAINPRSVLGESILRAASICSSEFSPFQHPFARSVHSLRSCACADVDMWSRNEKRRPSWRNGRGERRKEGGNRGGEMCEKIGENMGKKIEEKICEGERETVIYRVRSPRRIAEDGVKQPEVRRRIRSHHINVLLENIKLGYAELTLFHDFIFWITAPEEQKIAFVSK